MQFSLSSLKFEDVRQQIIEYLQLNNSYSGTFDWQASNISYLIDTMAYTTMLMSYQLANVSNNAFLDSTNTRKNAISIAKTLGYQPKRKYSSALSGKFTYYGEDFDQSCSIRIPAYSSFSTNKGSVFTNTSPIILSYKGDPTKIEADYSLVEGVQKTYISLGTGKPLQSFVIPSNNVAEGSLRIFVRPTVDVLSNPSEWKYTKTFSNIINPNIFFIEEDLDNVGFPKVIFGDGIIGKIPMSTDTIICNYIETQGSQGNGEILETLPDILNMTASPAIGTINVEKFDTNYKNINNVSYGGTEIETLDSIKQTAPRFFSRVSRAVTKNDYYSMLLENNYLQDVNVIGGEEFFINEDSILGNIFITAVPKLPLNFNDAQRIYLTDLDETKILFDFTDKAIISTKRIFYKPSYIYLDVFSSIEVNSNIPAAERETLKETVKQTQIDYFSNNFNVLGKPFRKSKLISATVDVTNIKSADLTIDMYFVLNGNSFYNVSSTYAGNFIYLPLIGVKDESGNIVSYKNFVKTNTEIADATIFADHGIVISDVIAHEGIAAANIIRYEYIINQIPEKATIYGQVYHKYLSRYIYNIDYAEIEIFKISQSSASLFMNNFVFIDGYNKVVSPKLILINDQQYKMVFTRDSIDFYVADLFIDSSNNFSIATKDVELKLFGITATADYNPFVISNEQDGSHSIKIIQISNNNFCDIKIHGKNKIFDMNLYEMEQSLQFKNLASFLNNNVEYQVVPTYNTQTNKIEVTYNSNLFLTIERNICPKFKGYITDVSELVKVYTDTAANVFTQGDYFIFALSEKITYQADYTNGVATDQIFNDQQIIYFTGIVGKPYEQWSLIKFLKEVDASNSAELFSNDYFGDVYKIGVAGTVGGVLPQAASVDSYIYFNDTSTENPAYKWDAVKPTLTSFNATLDIPTEVKFGDVKRVISNTGPSTFNGNVGSNNDEFGPFDDNDIIAYNGTALAGEKWKRILNINTLAASGSGIYPQYPATLPAPNSSSITFGTFYLISVGGNFQNDQNIIWSPENKTKQAKINDILIYVGSGKWTLFDYVSSFFIYTEKPTSLPIEIIKGQTFSILLGTSGNFNATLPDQYIDSDLILYLGDAIWKKINGSTIKGILDASYNSLPKPANIGEYLTIKVEGDFAGNPLLNASNKMCYFNDKLIFTGGQWEKIGEYTCYVDPAFKDTANGFGIKTDPHVKFDGVSKYYGIYCDDIFDGSVIGNYNYSTGKLLFNNRIYGYFNKGTKTTDKYDKSLIKTFFDNFDSSKVFSLIKITPIDKFDMHGNKTTEVETDFDTLFNQYIVSNINLPVDK